MNPNPVDQALQSEDRRFAAMANSDIETLEAVLADDLHYTHANGMVEDKAEFIRRIVSGERRYQAVTLVHRKTSAQPGFVAVFGQVEVQVQRASGLLVNRLDYTAIYRNDDPRLFAWSAVFSLKDPH
jgi:ketosteroid isomerase-like protein